MKSKLRLLALLPVLSLTAFSQPTITTYAGSDALFTGNGQAAASAVIAALSSVAVDAQGNIFIASAGQAMVFKVAPNGIITVVAGNGLNRLAGDGGPATGASLSAPGGIAVDAAGNLYIAETTTSVVRRVDASGVITNLAGTGQAGFSGDGGPAAKASLNLPRAVAADKAGNVYIADTGNQRIRRVAPNGTISTIAGTGVSGLTGDGGPATQAGFSNPTALAFDPSGNLYVADGDNHAIRKISAGVITTIAGTGGLNFSGDGGPANKAVLGAVAGVAADASGNIYIADSSNQRIRRADPAGIITSIAGNGQAGFGGDGAAATSAMFSFPAAIALDPAGALIVADRDNNRVRRVVPGGNVTTVAGQAVSFGDGGPSTQARLINPGASALDAAGNLYIADAGQNRIRRVTPGGTIGTVAGNGQTGNSGNGGPATSAALNGPIGVAVDSGGNLYIADSGNNQIRRVDAATGRISAFAGTGNCCYGGPGTAGDGGAATSAVLYFPTSITADPRGNIYFTNLVRLGNGVTQGAGIRRVTADGRIDTYVGSGMGFGGDGGPPAQALLGQNLSLASGPDGSLYIADRDNNRVRRVDSAGTTIATVASLSAPWSVTIGPAGELYVGSLGSVSKVTAGGTVGAYAGNGLLSFSGDGGPAASASIAIASALAADSAGNLYVTDGPNQRIRLVRTDSGGTLSVAPSSLTFSAASAGSSVAAQSFTVSSAVPWAVSAGTLAGGEWLSVSPSGGTVTVSVKPAGLPSGDYYGLVQVTSPSAIDPVQTVTVRLTVGASNTTAPHMASGGVLNGASFALQSPLAPGSLISIFGSDFTDAPDQVYTAPGFPWPYQLGGTSVTIGGELIPLYVVTQGQINAILPFDLPVNTALPLVVIHGNAVSTPEPVNLVASEPAIFTQTQTGSGPGIVVIVHPDGSQAVAGPNNAARAGDALVIYCTGLGAVNPRAVAGSQIPAQPLSQAIDPVTATIGGVRASVFYAGPTAGFTGLYQVNVTVPSGIAPGNAALILTQGGRASAAGVTVPVQ